MTSSSPIEDARITELEQLNRLAQVLCSTTGVADTLSAIVEASLSLCGGDRAAILLFDEEGGKEPFTIVRSNDASPATIDHTINLLVAGWVQHHGTLFTTTDILREFPFHRPSERTRAIGAALAVPLMNNGKAFGMINLVKARDAGEFPDAAHRVLGIIGTMAAQFVLRARLHETMDGELHRLRSSLDAKYGARAILGESKEIRRVVEMIDVISASNGSVLLIGETGTGKELVAKAVHFSGPRAARPFVAVNCAAIPAELFESELLGHEKGAFTGATQALKGKFETADGGTLFLDEISEMPLSLQPKMLRVLEERKFCRIGSNLEIHVDIRIIAASSKDLAQAVQQGTFKDALYHRLNVLPVVLPPLRERSGDIPILAEAMLSEFSSGAKRFDESALQFLSSRQWKGNVRELRNVIERIAILVPRRIVSAADVRSILVGAELRSPDEIRSVLLGLLKSSEGELNIPEHLEKELLVLALEQAEGNVSRAARLLGMERMALQRRIDRLHLS